MTSESIDKFLILLGICFFLAGTVFSYVGCFTTGALAVNAWTATWDSAVHSFLCFLIVGVRNHD